MADTNVSPAGSASVTSTPVASSGPPLATVTTYVSVSPSCGEASSTAFVTVRSAEPTSSPIVVVWLAESLVRSVSPVPDTVAVFVTVPDGVPSGTPTETVTVQVAPAASVSIVHTSAFAVARQAPVPDDVAPETVSTPGMESVSAMSLASSGPAFVTTIVYENESPGQHGIGRIGLDDGQVGVERRHRIGIARRVVGRVGVGHGRGRDRGRVQERRSGVRDVDRQRQLVGD